MTFRGAEIRRSARGRRGLLPARTFFIQNARLPFSRVRPLAGSLRLPAPGSAVAVRMNPEPFHVTRARCRAVRLPRADLTEGERR